MDTGGVTLSSATNNALQGLKNVTQNMDQTAQNIASGGAIDPQDVVSLSQDALSFKANVAVIKSSNEATQSLLNITA
jgi:hypothetical protein